MGRFTTPDPSGQEQNPYLYAAGDPVNRIDPEGLHSCWSWLDTPCSWLQDNLGDQDDFVIITGTTTIGSMGGSWGAYCGFMAGTGLSIGRNLAD
ncbi:RHS repeat-associated core domain-containing protein [Streptomyces rubiginosohelvolus]|uniref:RHS repeat-associated core domain-containing protein n=1 Tax=Streptomyces rubiginosohelvolus TaxID=67362 RepID=UPI0036B498F1